MSAANKKRVHSKKKFRIRPLVLTVLALLLLAAGGAFAYSYYQSLSNESTRTPNAQDGIDYSPATEEEKKESDRLKELDTQRDDNPVSSSVTPVIVDSSQYGDQIEVRAYVPGIIEDGGTCTITFTKDSLVITKQTAAARDATTTRCENLTVSRSEFQQSGDWSVVVSYSSQKYSGSSEPGTLKVE